MAIKTQDQFTEDTAPTSENFWINGQISDTGNQVKVQAGNTPFEIKTGSGLWEFSNSTTDADPGAAHFRFNNSTQASSTFIYMSKTDKLGADYGADFLAATTGSKFTIVENNEKGFEFETTGAVIDATTYVKIPVSNTIDLGGSIGNGRNCKIEGSGNTIAVMNTVNAASQLGWAYYVDSTYTSGSPLELRVGNSYAASVSIDGLGAGSTSAQWPAGLTEPWDTSTNRLIGTNDGDLYDFRLSFKAQDGASLELIDVSIDIGGAIGTILERSVSVQKGASVETNVGVSSEYFTGTTFIANDGNLILSTADSSSDMDIWDMEILIFRKYIGK